MYKETRAAKVYLRLKHYADEAYDRYMSRPSHANWEEANRTEEILADFAHKYEEQIFA